MPNSAATGRTMDEIAADKKRVWHSNRSAKEQSKAAKAGAGQNRRTPQAAPKPRARTPRRKTATKRSGKKPGKIAGARKATAAGLHPAVPCDAQRQGAGQRRLGPRDQVRRLSHPGADRRRQGHAEDPHRARLDRQISGGRRRAAPRSPATTSSSTARSSRSTTTACRISRRCRTISRTAARTGWSITSSTCCISTART